MAVVGQNKTSKDMRQERLLTTAEAAALLGLSVRTLKDYRKRGCGPKFERKGHHFIYYQWAEIDAWLKTDPPINTIKMHTAVEALRRAASGNGRKKVASG